MPHKAVKSTTLTLGQPNRSPFKSRTQGDHSSSAEATEAYRSVLESVHLRPQSKQARGGAKNRFRRARTAGLGSIFDPEVVIWKEVVSVSAPFVSPTLKLESESEVFVAYLDYYRDRVLDKVGSLSPKQLRTASLPSGWTPLELVRHLTYCEIRWLIWGFQGKTVTDPWGDRKGDRWFIDPATTAEEVFGELRQQGKISSQVIRAHSLDTKGQPGERWGDREPATLERILFHLLQEYARHVGHIDIIVELETGAIEE